MEFSLRYGQTRVRQFDNGEPVLMYHRQLSPKRSIQLGSDSGARLNQEYRTDGPDLAINVVSPLHVAQMYINGWPLLVGAVEGAPDAPPWRPDTAQEVAERELARMSEGKRKSLCLSLSPAAADAPAARQIAIMASQIDDPWSYFAVSRSTGRFVIDIQGPPSGIVFPRPDITRATQTLDPFWGVIHQTGVDIHEQVQGEIGTTLVTYSALRAWVESVEAERAKTAQEARGV